MKSGTLYLLRSRRPLSRVFARIPCNPPSWSRNNNLVGRGVRRYSATKNTDPEQGESVDEDRPPANVYSSSRPNVPSSDAERWSSSSTKGRPSLAGGELMEPEVFRAQMEAMSQKEDKADAETWSSSGTKRRRTRRRTLADGAFTADGTHTADGEFTIDGEFMANGEFMDPGDLAALMEAMPQKVHREQATMESPLSEAEQMYPGSYVAELEAILREEKEDSQDPHFMDKVKRIFRAQQEVLFPGKKRKERDNRSLATIEAELTRASKAYQEAGIDPVQHVEHDQPLESTPPWEPSEEIYVMGYDEVGRYIAFVLGATQTLPPVRFLIHRVNIWKEWLKCGRRVIIERATGPEVHNRIQAEFTSMKLDPPPPGPLIRNLIVTVPPGSVVRALEPIKHRLDHRSTICLVNNGLGVAEAIIEAHFPDELTRPAFVLGHMTTRLARSTGHFSVVEVEHGRLYLSLLATTRVGNLISKSPPPQRTRRFYNLAQLLMTVPDLNASSHPLPELLRFKLPRIALLSIAQPMSTIFGLPYDELLRHQTTRQIMMDMLGEICLVVSKMPACRNPLRPELSPLSVTLQKKFFLELHRRKTKKRKMEEQVSRAWETDIRYLTGYFIDRATEMKIPVPYLRAMYKILLAKRRINDEKLNNAIPFDDSVPLVDDLAPSRF